MLALWGYWLLKSAWAQVKREALGGSKWQTAFLRRNTKTVVGRWVFAEIYTVFMKGVSQMVRDSDQSKNWIKQILIRISAIVDNPMIKEPLIGISAIADWIAITSFAASIVKQDLLLIFLMAVAVIVILVVQ
jgi:hypothetical protein